MAAGDTAGGGEQEADTGAEWVRDGEVQVPERVRDFLRVRGEAGG